MELTAILAILVAIAILYDIARRIGVPYPTLLVLGGLGLAFVPGLPKISLEPDQRGVIGAQRTAVIELFDRGDINDQASA